MLNKIRKHYLQTDVLTKRNNLSIIISKMQKL